MSGTLRVHEIYLSLQGESTFAGLPCVFVRLTGCDLRCSYCDTAYAFTGGKAISIEAILNQVDALAEGYPEPPLVELTGGEPLLQKATPALLAALCDRGFTVLLETSGAHDISTVDARVHRIVDLKCPSSGECDRNHTENIAHLRPTDEVKCVIGTREDYVWAKEQLRQLFGKCEVLFSWVNPLEGDQASDVLKPVPADHTPLTRRELAEVITTDRLPVRFQLQQHKHIWPPEERGV
ncbi:MAG: 7-carboxy-7-deazaguanine synthase [Verrucomicrobiales bacterium]|nr:7-carboxy-7-deazaguanine synthase [Verrucomicrobiales bacterium]